MARKSFTDLIRRAYRAKDEAELERIEKEAKDAKGEEEDPPKGDDTHVHVHLPSGSADDDDDDDDDPDDKKDDKTEDAVAQFSKIVKDGFRNIDARLRRLEGRDKDKDGDEDDEYTEDGSRDDFPAANSGANPKSLGELGLLDPLHSKGADSARGRARDDARGQARDSTDLEEQFLDAVGDAEILAPGMRMPTFDARLAPRQTADRVCSLRRRAVDAAMRDEADREMLEELGARDVRRMSCDAVAVLFRAAVAAKNRRSNDALGGSGRVARAGAGNGPRTIDDLQKANNDFWDKRMGGATSH